MIQAPSSCWYLRQLCTVQCNTIQYNTDKSLTFNHLHIKRQLSLGIVWIVFSLLREMRKLLREKRRMKISFYFFQWCLYHRQNWHRLPCSCQHQGDQQPLEYRCSFSQSSFPELGFVNRGWQNPWIGTCYYKKKVTKSLNWVEMLIEKSDWVHVHRHIDTMIIFLRPPFCTWPAWRGIRPRGVSSVCSSRTESAPGWTSVKILPLVMRAILFWR